MVETAALVEVVPAIIEAGESLSGVCDISSGNLVYLTAPATWPERSVLSFQVSGGNDIFNDLYTAEGDVLTLYAVPSGVVVVPEEFRHFAQIKIRSGTPQSPIPVAERLEFSATIHK